MTISDEVKRLEEENAQLKRALAQILSAMQTALPLIQSVVGEPKPPEEGSPIDLAVPEQSRPAKPPAPQEAGDGAYHVDVSGMIPQNDYTHHTY